MSLELDSLRHSTAHLLAAAVVKLWPEAKHTIGPVIENGFYFDFDMGTSVITTEDLPRIEEEMKKLVKTWKSFDKIEVSADEARKTFKDNVYKIELIDELEKAGEKISFYESGKYLDLCRGGHVENVKDIKYFKLLSVAGAYWRGDEKNKMLTRVYGTVFSIQKELDDYIAGIEEASEFDHRKIGKDLGLFVFSDIIGKGLPMLTPRGATIRRVLERFIVDEEIRRGYQHVYTPPLAKTELYKKSGHYPYYKNTMYPVMKVDDEELILRPMTCPHHFMLFKSDLRSYRDLPVRYAEISPQYRYEKSGELTGLMRIRMFNLADAHIFTTKEKAKEEIKGVLDLIDFANNAMGLKKGEDYRYRLSLGDRSDKDEKYYKDDEAWEYAENILRDVLKESDVPSYEAKGEAAFYGPKIDVQIKKISGKEETAFTVQYDFVMPKRFELTYIDEGGKEAEVVVIHRASIGCLERTIAFLLEKYHGALPLWLSPIQVEVLPISEKHHEYGNKIRKQLEDVGIRAEVDDRNETLQNKIRNAQILKTPYMIILGDREVENDTVSPRHRTQGNLESMKIDDFVAKIVEEDEGKVIN
jgi:threonyl-tRNA synthetase